VFWVYADGMSDQNASLALISATFLVVASPSFGQVNQIAGPYEARLSGWCKSVHSEDVLSAGLGDFRVRKGGRLTATGLRQTIYVDAGGFADIVGTSSIVHVAKGGVATVAGERNQIFSESGGRVIMVGKVFMTMVGSLDLHVHKNATDCQ
jgi:hypothetical protein